MATESIQHGAATPPGTGYEAEVPAAGPAAAADVAEAGVLNDVLYVKDALATRKGGLSDAELNALSHLIMQLSTAFSVEQAFAANITSFEQLEKALFALEELLEQVEKAKAEIKEGLKTIILTEVLSAALGGLVAAKSFSTALSQYRYNDFFNKAQSNLRGRSAGDLGAGNTNMTPPNNSAYGGVSDTALTAPAMSSSHNLAPRPAAPNPSARRDAQPDSRDAASAGRRDAPENRTQEHLNRLDANDKPSWNPFNDGYYHKIPTKDLPSGGQLGRMDSETVNRLGSYASTNAQKLGYRAEFEMMGARLVQQFARSFSALGETQQSIANIDVNADTNVYSNQSEYWSVLMGTYQRLAQEYQTVFQHDLGALGEDVSQATQMAQYLYRS